MEVKNDLKTNPIDTEEKYMGVDTGEENYECNVVSITDEKRKNLENFDTLTEFQINKMLHTARETVEIVESNWNTTRKEFELSDDQMKQLYAWHEANLIQMPENISEEDKESFDYFQAIYNLPEEEINKIFPEDHPIIGIDNKQTLDRIHDAFIDFFNYLSAMRQYDNLNRDYLRWIEIKEESNIIELKMHTQKETDPEKKAIQEKSLKKYWYRKTLSFLAEPIDEGIIKFLVKSYGDKNKIEYWINRSRDKFKQMNISSKFILEISQFEKRFLPEKYHPVSNMLLLYFMNQLIYASNEDDKSKVMIMVVTLNGFVLRVYSDELNNKILNNIMKLLDQFIDPIIEAYPLESRENQ